MEVWKKTNFIMVKFNVLRKKCCTLSPVLLWHWSILNVFFLLVLIFRIFKYPIICESSMKRTTNLFNFIVRHSADSLIFARQQHLNYVLFSLSAEEHTT